MQMGIANKLKESKKLIRVAFHIRNNCNQKMKTEPLLVSFTHLSSNSKFKFTRITLGEIVNKFVNTVASQLCEGDNNLFAEQFFSNIVDSSSSSSGSQQNHMQLLQFCSQCITLQVQKQTVTSISTSSSCSTSHQICSCYNYNKTCKSTYNYPNTNNIISKQKQMCYYCDPLTTSPNKISSHEDVINEIQKRIVITSMSFPNSKTETNITIKRSNLNNIIQLQDMQHVYVHLKPLPSCFRSFVAALASSVVYSSIPSAASSQQFNEQELNFFAIDDNTIDYDIDNNNQFYEALPVQNRLYCSQPIQDEDISLADHYRKGEILDQQLNPQQLSTRSSSKKENNLMKGYNSHLSNSSSLINNARVHNNQDFSSHVSFCPNSTDVSLVFSNTESASVEVEEAEEMIQEEYKNSKQKCSKEQKQCLNQFEGMLQKRVKLNQDPISNSNNIHKEQIPINNFKKSSNTKNQVENRARNHSSSSSSNPSYLLSPLLSAEKIEISYEKFIEEIDISSKAKCPSQNNKFNQLKDQQQQFLSMDQDQSDLIFAQKNKNLFTQEIEENQMLVQKNSNLLKFGGDSNRKLKGECIFQNFNFNFAFSDNPDFLGSDSELMKTTLSQIETSYLKPNKNCLLNFNQQSPLSTNQSQEYRQLQTVQQEKDLEQDQMSLSQQQQNRQQTSVIDQTEQSYPIELKREPQLSNLEQLKVELRAQIFLEGSETNNDKKKRYLKKIFQDKKVIKKERMSRINEQNMDLINKLDNEISKLEKLRQSESTSSTPYFEDQSTRHTCSTQNKPSSKLSQYLKQQIKINRVLRFLDDSIISSSEEMKDRVSKNKEELEWLCRIIYTISKHEKITCKSYEIFLEQTTEQMNKKYFINKQQVDLLFQDLLKIFTNWIALEQTNYGLVFQINQNFRFKQVRNFFSQNK
ncbi:hypothetical protein TTHERM_00632960 (macronuclear) [Tetrahymena thermophila SB210]|uniref:Uncharacterized protein n=1 Tax=Tetrahymena thermophila (strain SB210) TaxID=312017 RepID=Q22X57_TETTS|nr:hypothetical protein TTHERM_00632960 [Tetrahymena thermophila SB210]EAR89789.2 hypothetical protein TTHERM_00632960 [Tetrahymena thermophila SB210]|eukprot:XP_001010034.2 hypothetical protein TTHERM_00632960 [Tetrahymena thermophila SB210]